jgi:EAL domain-containing protein (putative c-di-GMP-specific phosphodiesterase class I)/GGDEF domain-containing protein/PAS domain-containing protein
MPTVAASEHVVPNVLNNDPALLGVLFDSNPLPMAMLYADTMELFAVNDAWRNLRGEVSPIEVEVERSRRFVHEGRPACLATFFDVSELNRATDSMRANIVLLETADDVTGIEMFSLDLRTGEQQNPLRGAPVMTHPTADDAPHSIADSRPFESDFAGGAGKETRWFHSGTQLVYGEDGVPTHIVGVTADVTERRLMADELLARAYRDAQTGLPNREAMLNDGVTLTESTTGMLLLHIHVVSGFAERDHHLKARIMQEAARVIVATASSDATVVRYADEIFGVITAQRGRNRSLLPLAKRLLESFERPLRIGDEESVVIPSIGIAAERGHRRDATLLCHEAECALDVARHDDSHLAVYDEVLANSADRRATIEKYLRYAISRHRISVAYQPIVSLLSGHMVGAEALMRWDCPGLGNVPPTEFIQVAEQSGAILKLGEWILRSACAQARGWQLAGHTLRVAVNVSGLQVKEHDFVRIVTAACEAAELDPALLELEITESTIMRYDGMALRNLQALRRLGTRISIDDFGTGYSSLSYLKSLPLDTLKIDRSFTVAITGDRFQAEVTRSVIRLAHQRGLYVVGEGVETVEQLSMLRAMDCDEAQGYLMSRPVGEADFLASVTRDRLKSIIKPAAHARGA